MRGRVPIPEGEVVTYEREKWVELNAADIEEMPLPDFLEKMRIVYADWEQFIASRPDLEWQLTKASSIF